MQPFTRRFAAVPVSAEYPVLLKIGGRCETGEVYTPSGDAQTVGVYAIARLGEMSINITLLYFSDIGLYAQGS